MNPQTTYKCDTCSEQKPKEAYRVSSKGTRSKTCHACVAAKRTKTNRRNKQKQNWETLNAMAVELKKKGFTSKDAQKIASYLELLEAV